MLHTSEQQSDPFEQRSPVCTQNDELSWQRPLEQSFEQHSESLAHVLPAVVQALASAAHFPFVHCPLQHSPADVQAWPSTTQAAFEQVPLTHESVQHSVEFAQLEPEPEHLTTLEAHEWVFASQMLEQQSAAEAQESPNLRQVT
jgi:hypothetical protein